MPDFIVHAIESSRVPRYMPDRSSIETVLAAINARSTAGNRLVLPARIVRRAVGGGIGGGYETHVSILAHRTDRANVTQQALAAETARIVREALARITIPPVLVGDDVPTNWTSVTATPFDPVVNGPLTFWEGPGAQASVTRTRDDVSAFSPDYPENTDGPNDPARHQTSLVNEAGQSAARVLQTGLPDLKSLGVIVAVGIGLYAVVKVAPIFYGSVRSRSAPAPAPEAPRANPRRRRRP